MTAVTFRPKRIRVVAIPAAAAVAILFIVLSFGLKGNAGFEDARMSFQRGDQAAMIGLGLLLGLGILTFCRPRVVADDEGVHIRNVVGGYDLPWSVVRAVRFDRNSAWAHLELHDDEQVAIHALQAVDKDYAVDGVRTLRALHSAASDA
ncbi:PH domain-containing protein [Actinoplanes sp. GCM10030250]|uniref:PH domain-containing protein n=1 Tax=Actinoplanes sp. GCM10030250 TaxID=3273376 RepID=UPI003622A94C